MTAERRLFFALWPPAPVIAAIQRLQTQLGPGRATPVAKLHVTLAFHGLCDQATYQQLLSRAEQVHLPAPRLVFDQLGGPMSSGVTWLGMSQPPAPLVQLAAALASPDLEDRPYVPHITLLRQSQPPPVTAVTPLIWRARQFSLVESGVQGVAGGYRSLASWRLLDSDVR